MFRILAPTTYIFFASAIPVISFGEQLERSTGMLNKQQLVTTLDLALKFLLRFVTAFSVSQDMAQLERNTGVLKRGKISKQSLMHDNYQGLVCYQNGFT